MITPDRTVRIQADYLVVGAGAAGMAFVDALIHNADVHVALIDRRHSAGGHWLDAYPFVKLHQASEFYGVVSTPLGKGERQAGGPEAGMFQRAAAPDIVAYYARVLESMVTSGKVTFFPNSEHLGGRRWASRLSRQHFDVPDSCRVVNAHYLAPHIPAETPAPFGVADGVCVIPVNDLVRLSEIPGQFVIVGSGKTATDAIVFSVVINNPGNITSRKETLTLTVTGGPDIFEQSIEVEPLEPGRRRTIVFDPVVVEPGVSYDVAATLMVTHPDFDLEDNQISVGFTVNEGDIEEETEG